MTVREELERLEHQIGERRGHELPHQARAAQDSIGDELRRDDEIERRDDAQEHDAGVHRKALRAVEKDVYQRAAREHIEQNQRHTQRPHELQPRAETGTDAVIFCRAEILRRVV